MKVAFVYAGGREERLSLWHRQQCPSDFFYGALELQKIGVDVTILDAPERSIPILSPLYDWCLDWATPVRVRGAQFFSAATLLRRLFEFDVVVATSTSLALALNLWFRVFGWKGKLVGIHCGLVNYPLQGPRLASTRFALRGTECVLFAASERVEMVRRFQLPESAVHVNDFGIDTEFWTPGEEMDEGFFLSVGNDGRRDYETLVEAARGISIPLKIVTARSLPEVLPENVEHVRSSWHQAALTDVALRDLYRRCRAVVIPLQESIQPSGQSVALQAMACGKPVILTSTSGLWMGAHYQNGQHVFLVEPGSVDAMRVMLERVYADTDVVEKGRSAREAVVRSGNIVDFAERLRKLL